MEILKKKIKELQGKEKFLSQEYDRLENEIKKVEAQMQCLKEDIAIKQKQLDIITSDFIRLDY